MSEDNYVPFEKLEEKVLAYYGQELLNEPPRNYLGASSIGDICDRRIWLNWKGIKPFSRNPSTAHLIQVGKRKEIFERGKDEEKKMIAVLGKVGYQVWDQQKNISDFDGKFQGHIDGLIKDEKGEIYILELKTFGQKYYNQIVKKKVKEYSDQYYSQIQLYMNFLNINKTFVVGINKNSGLSSKNHFHYYQEIVLFDPHYVKGLLSKIERLLLYGDEMPARLGTNESTYYACKFCEHYKFCYEKEEEVHA